MGRDVWGINDRAFKSQRLGLSDEIPRVVFG